MAGMPSEFLPQNPFQVCLRKSSHGIHGIHRNFWRRIFSHGFHRIHRSFWRRRASHRFHRCAQMVRLRRLLWEDSLVAAWVWQDAIPSYICVNLCYLWETLRCKKLLWVPCVLWEYSSPTDCTDQHRWLVALVRPRNPQNSQKFGCVSGCVGTAGCHTLLNLLSMLKSKCFDHYFHFKLRFYILGYKAGGF